MASDQDQNNRSKRCNNVCDFFAWRDYVLEERKTKGYEEEITAHVACRNDLNDFVKYLRSCDYSDAVIREEISEVIVNALLSERGDKTPIDVGQARKDMSFCHLIGDQFTAIGDKLENQILSMGLNAYTAEMCGVTDAEYEELNAFPDNKGTEPRGS